MNTEMTAEPVVTNTREALLASMMIFSLAKRRHAIACKMQRADEPNSVLAHRMTVRLEEAAYRDMLEAMLSWIDEGGDGFEQLAEPARAWSDAESALDASAAFADEHRAAEAFDALAAACERLAGVVAAVN